MKAKITFKNIKAYIQGTWRSKLMFTEFEWLIPRHVTQQICMRIKSMDRECYDEGNCQMCGCMTPALQMANKACDKPCYPTMVGYWEWGRVKRGGLFYDDKTKCVWQIKNNRFNLISR
jgi:hypothetical protein